MRAACLYKLNLVEFIILTMSGEEYKLWNSPLYNFLQLPVTYPSLVHMFFPSILTWKITWVLLTWETEFHTHAKLQARLFIYVCFYILALTFLHRRKDKVMNWIETGIPQFNLLLISSWTQWWLVTVVPKYFNDFDSLNWEDRWRWGIRTTF